MIMPSHTSFPSDVAAQTLDVRVSGPDSEPVFDADLRRLFPGGALTHERLDRLRTWPRVLVCCGDRPVAIATCQKTEVELRVPEIGIDSDCGCSTREVYNVLLDALEIAGLAGGCRRVVINPPRTSVAFMERRGYHRVAECCAGGWIEKTLC
jgi:hypothetical protein